jgi:hypothetical protein
MESGYGAGANTEFLAEMHTRSDSTLRASHLVRLDQYIDTACYF